MPGKVLLALARSSGPAIEGTRLGLHSYKAEPLLTPITICGLLTAKNIAGGQHDSRCRIASWHFDGYCCFDKGAEVNLRGRKLHACGPER